jgi:ketosteroid isomerase-like protein
MNRLAILFPVLTSLPFVAGAGESADPVLAQVLARDAELAAAHGRGDMDTYRKGLSKKYVYIDVGGGRTTADKLGTRRSNDQLRLVSSEALEEESVRISDDVVLLRGLERGSYTYFGGLPRRGENRWTALWAREEDGQWRLVAETATPVVNDAGLPFLPARLADAEVRSREGVWKLALPQALALRLVAGSGQLEGSLEGQPLKLTFVPASSRHYFALERPFELRFEEDDDRVTLITWGIPTPGQRLKEPTSP